MHDYTALMLLLMAIVDDGYVDDLDLVDVANVHKANKGNSVSNVNDKTNECR